MFVLALWREFGGLGCGGVVVVVGASIEIVMILILMGCILI